MTASGAVALWSRIDEVLARSQFYKLGPGKTSEEDTANQMSRSLVHGHWGGPMGSPLERLTHHLSLIHTLIIHQSPPMWNIHPTHLISLCSSFHLYIPTNPTTQIPLLFPNLITLIIRPSAVWDLQKTGTADRLSSLIQAIISSSNIKRTRVVIPVPPPHASSTQPSEEVYAKWMEIMGGRGRLGDVLRPIGRGGKSADGGIGNGNRNGGRGERSETRLWVHRAGRDVIPRIPCASNEPVNRGDHGTEVNVGFVKHPAWKNDTGTEKKMIFRAIQIAWSIIHAARAEGQLVKNGNQHIVNLRDVHEVDPTRWTFIDPLCGDDDLAPLKTKVEQLVRKALVNRETSERVLSHVRYEMKARCVACGEYL